MEAPNSVTMAEEANPTIQCTPEKNPQSGEIWPRSSVPPCLVIAPTKSFLASKLAEDIAEFSKR